MELTGISPVQDGSACLTGTHCSVLSIRGLGSSLISQVPCLVDALGVVGKKKGLRVLKFYFILICRWRSQRRKERLVVDPASAVVDRNVADGRPRDQHVVDRQRRQRRKRHRRLGRRRRLRAGDDQHLVDATGATDVP